MEEVKLEPGWFIRQLRRAKERSEVNLRFQSAMSDLELAHDLFDDKNGEEGPFCIYCKRDLPYDGRGLIHSGACPITRLREGITTLKELGL